MVIVLYTGWQHTCEAARESIKWLLYFTWVVNIHCNTSPFGKQLCLANKAIFPSYITFQNNQKENMSSKAN
jgi:hypothetical protein